MNVTEIDSKLHFTVCSVEWKDSNQFTIGDVEGDFPNIIDALNYSPPSTCIVPSLGLWQDDECNDYELLGYPHPPIIHLIDTEGNAVDRRRVTPKTNLTFELDEEKVKWTYEVGDEQ
tara:strand:- start:80 stop:430 length:351 start_codon:yes stop_codon:yes gene_type:complete